MANLLRRHFVVACAALSAASAFAQSWPTKPIRVVVAYGAGSPPDTFARIYAEHLSHELGATVVVDNKPGASGNIASAEVAKSAGDGYTFLYNVSSAFTINPFVYTRMPVDLQRDLVPVGTTMTQGFVLVANNDVKVKDLPDLLAQAKARPGKLSYASWGIGSYSHVLMELVLQQAGGEMLHVPYRTAPLNEVVGGQVDVLIEPMASAAPFITSGRVKALAFTGEARHPSMQQLPTFAEALPGVTLRSWHGIWAPASTPRDIVSRFNAAMVKASKDPRVVQKLAGLNVEPLGASPEDMTRMIAKEAAVYGPLLKAKNIRLD